MDSLYDVSMPDIDGHLVDFAQFRDQTLVIVNVASH